MAGITHDFTDRVALVTGAGSGIGRALSLALASRGARLVLADIAPSTLQETASGVRDRGVEAIEVVADVSSRTDVQRLADEALGGAGRVDILFNNAGVAVISPVEATTAEDWSWVIGVNLLGPVYLTQALLPHMLQRGSGHIVMTASIAGLVGAPHMAAYSLTKFGIVGFAESMRVELEQRGIRITTVCPGFVRTNLGHNSRYHNSRFRDLLLAPPSWYGDSVDDVARKILDAVGRGERLLPMGIERLGWYVHRLLPRHSHHLTRWMARRMGLGL